MNMQQCPVSVVRLTQPYYSFCEPVFAYCELLQYHINQICWDAADLQSLYLMPRRLASVIDIIAHTVRRYIPGLNPEIH